MELTQLKYAVQVADCGNFSRASETLFVTQPTLSQQIQKLEIEINMKLFDRSTRHLVVTPAGKKFVTQARRVLDEMEALEQLVATYHQSLKHTLSLGMMPNLANYYIPQYLNSFQFLYPHIETKLYLEWSHILIDKVLRHEIDFAFINISPEQINAISKDLKVIPFLEDHLVVIGHSHGVLEGLSEMTIADLQHYPLLMYPPQASISQILNRLLLSQGIEPHIRCICPTMESLIDMVKADMGIAIMSSGGAKQYTDIQTVSLFPVQKIDTALVMLKQSSLSLEQQYFLDYSNGIVHGQ